MLRRLTQRAGFTLVEARRVRPVPTSDAPTGSLSCVARLPEALADQVHDRVRAWPGAEAHHVYPASSLHVTLLNLAAVDGHDDKLALVTQILHEAAPIPLLLHGFGATSHSVFVRVLDPSGALGSLRRRLVAVTGDPPPWRLRRLAFVNVLRYRTDEAADLVRAAAETPLGPTDLEVDRAQLVRTDRLFSAAATEVLRDVALSGSRSPRRR